MYDDLIKYYEDETWKKYFGVDLAELYSCVEGFLILRDRLIQQVADKTVDELMKESNIYKDMFFGGFTGDESKPLSENALARFYKECIGVGVENLPVVVSRLKEGLTLESAAEGIRCGIEDTLVVERLRKMSSKLKSVYKSLKPIIEKPEAKEYKMDNSLFGVEALKDILNAGKKILPLYNPVSFFITSIYSIPSFYVREAYPRLFEESTKNLLNKYGIRLGKLLEPDLPDEKIKREREIIGLVKGHVGYLLREIILDVYSLFQLDDLRKFFKIEDEFAKFVKINAGKLRESIVIDQFAEVIKRIKDGSSDDYLDSEGRCKVPEEFKVYYPRDYYGGRGIVEGGNVKLEAKVERKLNYTEFVAFLSPIMFLGLAYIRPVSQNEFYWRCLLGWEGE
ncbi:MAG: hypothetical protein J7L07_00060 [Candidatus Odinarchaeota archaeon]|nr:hypothetical protein [Candidatus Odinarchaeota archaeon]